MSDMMDTLRGILGDDADEKIKGVMSSLSKASSDSSQSTENGSVDSGINAIENLDHIMRIKGIIEEMQKTNDSRSQLLLSLKPYMREGRRKNIDNAIKMLNITRLSGLFK